ncbi:MAG: hypothetical protein AAGA59_25510 [Actinomycetota bacterium]
MDPRSDTQRGAFNAVITAIHHEWIVLDQTRFDPTHNGRQSDLGFIESVPVVGVAEEGIGLLHRVDDPHATQGMRMGQVVRCRIDLDRRCRLMRLHSLQHLLTLGYQASINRAERGVGTVTDQRTTVELRDSNRPPEIDVVRLQRWVERVISDDLSISSLTKPPEPGRRFWQVDGVGVLACEGRHLTRTSEIGAVRLEAETRGESTVLLTGALL